MFAAIFNRTGNPVEARPGDIVNPAGARHVALLRPDGSCDVHQLHGRFWIVGRVRLDGARALRDRLQIADASPRIPDALLCLHAYAAWGERFVDFLAGDFCFALWDSERGCLLAVRDQLGVRSLFHANIGDTWFISDSLDWIAGQPSGDRALDDYWIADFLTLGYSREFGRTVYRDVGLLGPARLLRVSQSGAQFQEYWRLAVDEPLYLSSPGAYAERFREVLTQAIADRLPTGNIGISMSGGLDSTTLAACTVTAVQAPSRVVAECEIYEQLPELREGYFASLAARHLEIDLNFRSYDALCYDPQWRSRGIRCAQPEQTIVNADLVRRAQRELAVRSTVWFHGEGPDNALTMDGNAYLRWMLKRSSWNRLATVLLQHARLKGVAGWAQTFRRYTRRTEEDGTGVALPQWLDRDFVDRTHLAERIGTLGLVGETNHPWHPYAMACFTGPLWQRHFGDFDFQESLAPVVWRHPYFDLRVLRFMLSVPPVPWGWKKHLLREAMRGRLPDEVLAREKTSLPYAPDLASIRATGLPAFSGTGALAQYVDVSRLPSGAVSDYELRCTVAAQALDYWLSGDNPQPGPPR